MNTDKHVAKRNANVRFIRLTPAKAFSQLYNQITVNSWDRMMTLQAMEQVEKLVTQVPIYHLSCTISEEAVKCLEEVVQAKK